MKKEQESEFERQYYENEIQAIKEAEEKEKENIQKRKEEAKKTAEFFQKQKEEALQKKKKIKRRRS